MKNYKLVTTLMLIGFSLGSYAQFLTDEEDLQLFREKNYCQGCDLSGARIDENHDNGSLLSSFAIKTEFLGSLYKMNFSGSIMTYAKFSGGFFDKLSLQEALFDKVNLSYSNFKSTDASGSNFTDVNLSNADFNNANFSGVDFTNANLSNVTIQNSILIGAILSEPQLKQIKSIQCTVMPNGEFNSKGC